MNKDTPRLLRLSDSTLTLERPEDDLRDRKVFDSDEEEIGRIGDLFIDQGENKVRFLMVKSGGFLGIGAEEILIPVDAISRIDEKGVHIAHGREHIAGAPQYDPELVTADYYQSLYGYYGYGPFWSRRLHVSQLPVLHLMMWPGA